MTAQMPMLSPVEQRPRTFYNEHGDWFGWACVGLAAVVVVVRLRKRLSLPDSPATM
jgi:apolipoprotein N-acyltransferase